ncbi:hypothetical protein MLD38_026246 [Melastoma candidum]|uniref:Uncharacterized protein n=1 Tax=Melastoma candidum TaxID=119954 RepID=A0ACB9NXR1_9MYRT|nr:hypothetical protein MLD38_026246 [Melastoma candidum]
MGCRYRSEGRPGGRVAATGPPSVREDARDELSSPGSAGGNWRSLGVEELRWESRLGARRAETESCSGEGNAGSRRLKSWGRWEDDCRGSVIVSPLENFDPPLFGDLGTDNGG